MMNWYGGAGDVGLLGGLVMIVVVIVVVSLAVLSVRALFPPPPGNERESALEILNRRLAAGELSQAEYEQARRSICQPW